MQWLITNKKQGEFRALMLIQRMVNKKGGHQLILSCTGGQWNSIEEDAWTCACRDAREETGGFATTPPAHVAWLGQSKKSPVHINCPVHQECPRRAVFMYKTSDGMLAEPIRNLFRPYSDRGRERPVASVRGTSDRCLGAAGSSSRQGVSNALPTAMG